MTTPTEPAPWLWVIQDADGRVLDRGRQWTSLLAPARTVAEERIAVWSYARIRAQRAAELVGVVCHVRRAGDSSRPATASTAPWIRRAVSNAAAIRT